MTHATDQQRRLHSGLEQDRRERDWDRQWSPVEALRETGHLGPVAGTLVMAAIGIYIAAWMAGRGDLLGGLVIGAVAVVGGGLMVDTQLCKGTPAHVHECRRCRRETDRWRGPTRDEQWVTALVGQSSAASQTPPATRYAIEGPPEPRSWRDDLEPAVREITEPRTVHISELLQDEEVDSLRAAPNGGAGD